MVFLLRTISKIGCFVCNVCAQKPVAQNGLNKPHRATLRIRFNLNLRLNSGTIFTQIASPYLMAYTEVRDATSHTQGRYMKYMFSFWPNGQLFKRNWI